MKIEIRKLTAIEVAALNEVAKKLDIPASWLCELINHESRWNPTIKNKVSSARGLIQFMDATAKGMGFAGGSAELVSKYPTAEAQLRTPVMNYLKMYAPYATNAELYGAVFYPAWRKSNSTKLLPDSVRAANKGIDTMAHYTAFVKDALPEYRAGKFNVSTVIEKNSGFVEMKSIQDTVPDSTKSIWDILHGVDSKKKNEMIAIAVLLTLPFVVNHISKKGQVKSV